MQQQHTFGENVVGAVAYLGNAVVFVHIPGKVSTSTNVMLCDMFDFQPIVAAPLVFLSNPLFNPSARPFKTSKNVSFYDLCYRSLIFHMIPPYGSGFGVWV